MSVCWCRNPALPRLVTTSEGLGSSIARLRAVGNGFVTYNQDLLHFVLVGIFFSFQLFRFFKVLPSVNPGRNISWENKFDQLVSQGQW